MNELYILTFWNNIFPIEEVDLLLFRIENWSSVTRYELNDSQIVSE